MEQRPLGKPTPTPDRYAPEVLVGIPRVDDRRLLGLDGALPFDGVDVWNAWELSWLDARGKPEVATAEMRVPATSEHMVESKSLKLYLQSLAQGRHGSVDEVAGLIRKDLTGVIGLEPQLQLTLLSTMPRATIEAPAGTCIDDAQVSIDTYEVDAGLLDGSTDGGDEVDETLHSNLLKSNCPVTGQPDWATLVVHYRGPRIDREALLRYVVSYRKHDGFHEHCVERIFVDLKRRCRPEELSVLARYTRRGGIDINPCRGDSSALDENLRLWRQ